MRRIWNSAAGPFSLLIVYVVVVSAWALLDPKSLPDHLPRYSAGFVMVVLAVAGARLLGTAVRYGAHSPLRAAARLFDDGQNPGHDGDPRAVFGLYDGRYTAVDYREWQVPGDWEMEPGQSDFQVRMDCSTPLQFEVKAWGVLIGPPLIRNRMPAELTGGEPVNFTTDSAAAFTFWRERKDLRAAAEAAIVRHHVSALRVSGGSLSAWWWQPDVARLPGAFDALARLARILDPREAADHRRKRACGRCGAPLGPADGFCTACGAGWWQGKP